MKVCLLAGGMGTRLKELTETIPKPLVKIGPEPVLWHIMKTYSHYKHDDFIICLGYLGDKIKDYFLNYWTRNCDLTINLANRDVSYLNSHNEPWTITFADTGLNTPTGGRISAIKKYIGNEPFLVSYGDGVANIDITKLIDFHKKSKRLATVTAVHPPSRFGELSVDGSLVTSFQEKPQVSVGYISAGFFVFEPQIFDYLDSNLSLEEGLLTSLAKESQLSVYLHDGPQDVWYCMDTFREMELLNDLWNKGVALWRIWK